MAENELPGDESEMDEDVTAMTEDADSHLSDDEDDCKNNNVWISYIRLILL